MVWILLSCWPRMPSDQAWMSSRLPERGRRQALSGEGGFGGHGHSLDLGTKPPRAAGISRMVAISGGPLVLSPPPWAEQDLDHDPHSRIARAPYPGTQVLTRSLGQTVL